MPQYLHSRAGRVVKLNKVYIYAELRPVAPLTGGYAVQRIYVYRIAARYAMPHVRHSMTVARTAAVAPWK